MYFNLGKNFPGGSKASGKLTKKEVGLLKLTKTREEPNSRELVITCWVNFLELYVSRNSFPPFQTWSFGTWENSRRFKALGEVAKTRLASGNLTRPRGGTNSPGFVQTPAWDFLRLSL